MQSHLVSDHILSALKNAFQMVGVKDVDELTLEKPADPAHGDSTCTFALSAFRNLPEEQKIGIDSPRALGEAVVAQLNQTDGGDGHLWSKLEVAGPGFINFTLSPQVLWNVAVNLAQNHGLQPENTQHRNEFIEYVSPNTNKPLHIGHLRNAALGKALINLHQLRGAKVTKGIIKNDRGLHIMKSTWAYLVAGRIQDLKDGRKDGDLILRLGNEINWEEATAEWDRQNQNSDPGAYTWLRPEEMSDERLQKPDHFVGYWYQLADLCVDDPSINAVWGQMLQSWEDDSHPSHTSLHHLWQHMNAWFDIGFNQTKDRYGFEFDGEGIAWESQIYQHGKVVVQEGAERGIFQKLEDGAIKVDLSQFNLPDKILLRRDGTGVYMTQDIELTRLRTDMGMDHLYWVVGKDQLLYFQQLFAVSQLLGFGQTDKYTHIAHGMVRLPEGKMSSRKGLVVYADDLIDLAIARAKDVMNATTLKKDLQPAEFDQIATAVGIGAVKWTMLSVEATSDVTFDLEKSVAFTGFAGPYVQYTYARAQSILAKAVESGITVPLDTFNHISNNNDGGSTTTSLDPQTGDVLRNLFTYYETIKHSSENNSPHTLCIFLYDLCQRFNAFYASNSVLGEGISAEERGRRLVLVAAVSTVLKQGLELLGIAAVEKM